MSSFLSTSRSDGAFIPSIAPLIFIINSESPNTFGFIIKLPLVTTKMAVMNETVNTTKIGLFTNQPFMDGLFIHFTLL